MLKLVRNASLLYGFAQLARKRRGACLSVRVARRCPGPGGLYVYGSNKHLARLVKLILNKISFPDVILVCHGGHDWPAFEERLDVLFGVVHSEEY